jgi:hypothetical protein
MFNTVAADVAEALGTVLNELAYSDLDYALAGKVERTTDLQATGYLTSNTGLELVLADGSRYVITVQKVR